ncbi:MAG: potassium channel family protein [Candidatus Limnocylindrales bacterium]
MTEPDDTAPVEHRPGRMPLLHSFVRAFRAGLEDPAFRALGGILVALLVAGTIAFHFVEGWNWLDSLYFCVITMATVGYGDFHPVTPLGKILAMIYIVLGLGVLVGFAQQLLSHMIDDLEEHPLRRRRRRSRAANEHPPGES